MIFVEYFFVLIDFDWLIDWLIDRSISYWLEKIWISRVSTVNFYKDLVIYPKNQLLFVSVKRCTIILIIHDYLLLLKII